MILFHSFSLQNYEKLFITWRIVILTVKIQVMNKSRGFFGYCKNAFTVETKLQETVNMECARINILHGLPQEDKEDCMNVWQCRGKEQNIEDAAVSRKWLYTAVLPWYIQCGVYETLWPNRATGCAEIPSPILCLLPQYTCF